MSGRGIYLGIDVGTSFVKAAVVDEDANLLGRSAERSGPDLQASIRSTFETVLGNAGAAKESIRRTVATGYGRRNVGFADDSKTEISCHARGAYHYFPRAITIIDIGGQDTKVIKLDAGGKRVGFKMNRKCAAGTGTFLEEIAHKLGVRLEEMNALASRSAKRVPLSSYCTVFASTEILTRIKEGEKVEDMVRSAFESVARRIIEMDSLEGAIVLTGGVVAHNDILVKIIEGHLGGPVLVPPYPQFTGAIGAALIARESG